MTAASTIRVISPRNPRWARRYGAPLVLLLAGAWLWLAFVPPPGLPTLVDLGAFGGSYSVACGMNDRGQVVGWAERTDGARRAFLWDRGRMRDLGTLPGCLPAEVLTINNRGQIAGLARRKAPAAPLLFLWENGRVRPLGGVPSNTYALVLNERGQIVGSADPRAFLWESGRLRWLDVHPWRRAYADDLDDSGAVVGSVVDAHGKSHAAVWERGVWRSLRLESRFGWSAASGISNKGDIVGTATERFATAVLWRGGLPRLLTVPGARVTVAHDVDDRGTVLGCNQPLGRGKEWRPVLWGSRGPIAVPVRRLSPGLRITASRTNNRGWICGQIEDPPNRSDHAIVILPPWGGWE